MDDAEVLARRVCADMLIKDGTDIASATQREYAQLIGKKKLKQLREILEELHSKTREDAG